MKLKAIQAAEAKLLLPTYERNPILFVDGEGMYLIDENGERYLDLLSGIGVNALGYGHPAVTETINRQSRKLVHISNLYFHEGQAELALRLTERTGLDRAFFCNSGTEAWEAAMKLARAYSALKRSEGHAIGTKFLALENSFHGRTMGSVSTTHKDKYREPFQPLVPGVEFVRFNDVDHLRASFSNEVCAILLEPVQGEGGIRPVSQEFFAAARELTQSTGALLIADEIQSGLGRTGKWFAYQQFGIQPDITTLAKPLAGGLPLGAMLCTRGSVARHPCRPAWHHLRRRTAGLRGGHRGDRHDRAGRIAHKYPGDGRVLQAATARSGGKARERRGRARHGADVGDGDELRRPGQADRRQNAGAAHPYQSHQRDRPAFSAALHHGPRARGSGYFSA